MNFRLLKIQAFVVAATLSIALLLFAAQNHKIHTGAEFRAVVDLTASTSLRVDLNSRNTILVAPAKIGGVWTVDTLPTTRLVAPLAALVHVPNSVASCRMKPWVAGAHEKALGTSSGR